MKTILQLNTSLNGEQALSSRLASELSTALAAASGATVVVRDLARQPLPHLTAERFAAFVTPAPERTLEQQRHVARAGVTFRYTPQGPVGLLGGRKAYVFATRGGRYAGTDGDLQSAYVRRFLGFIGIDQVEFVYAEGLALGAEPRERAVAEATSRIRELAA